MIRSRAGKLFLLMMSVGLIAALLLLITPGVAYAARSVTLSDNETYDLSSVKGATNLYIKAGGTYTLTGSTDKVLLYIDVPQGQSATVHFSGQTSLAPRGNAPGVSWADRSAITIGETGGEVVLMSDVGSVARLYGYGDVPALRKDGTSTKLRFRTQDPKNPGTISVVADQKAYRTCAIGGYGRLVNWGAKDNVAGEMYFESGYVEAYGSSANYVPGVGSGGGAAIGGDIRCRVKGLYFTGASVKAVAGDEDSAAIGTSSSSIFSFSEKDYFGGLAENIFITGGSVVATHDKSHTWVPGGGAGIGGGAGCHANNIVIEGGRVQAEGSRGSAAIGGGCDGNGTRIRISGGEVEATSGGNAIGGGSSSPPEYGPSHGVADVTISGGKVVARSLEGASGIGGSAHQGSRKKYAGNIVITGGEVHAYGSGYGSGLGSGGAGCMERIAISGGKVFAQGGELGVGIGSSKVESAATRTVSITGGVVEAIGGAKAEASIGGYDAIGAFWEKRQPAKVCIDGGNVKAEKGIFGGPAHRSDGAEVFPIKIRLETFDDGVRYFPPLVAELSNVRASSPDQEGYQYGLNDLYLFEKTPDLWVWLPKDAAVTYVYVTPEITKRFDHRFAGYAKGDDVQILYPATKLNLDGNGSAQPLGHADIFQGAMQPDFFVPHLLDGFQLEGYSTAKDSSGELVIDRTGALVGNVDGFTSNGKWIHLATKENYKSGVTLYARWKAATYSVAFDANAPRGASTSISGAMSPQEIEFGAIVNLSANEYKLPGYAFEGWNTAADGAGDHYGDGATVENLAGGEAAVTLYAQWTPLTYKVVFERGAGTSGSMADQTLTFDKSEELKPNEFTFPNYVFLGWHIGKDDDNLYQDKAIVCNIGSLDAAGQPQNVTLRADWILKGGPIVVVTDNGKPVDFCAVGASTDAITFWKDGSKQTQGNTSMALPGVYVNSALTKGEYEVRVEGFCTEFQDGESVRKAMLSVDENNYGLLVLNFYTVAIEPDENTQSSIFDPETKASAREVSKVLSGRPLEIRSSANEGYVFERYRAYGVEPDWTEDVTDPNQIVRVKGRTTIEAYSRPVAYRVVFNANGGTGNAPFAQPMMYGESQNLLANTFSKSHHTFAGWTTTPGWTGKIYKDGERVENLSTVDKDEVTLYAQWISDAYFIRFNDNGAGGLMLKQKLFYDTESPLSQNDFSFENHHFIGWNTASDGSGTSYAEDQNVMNILPDETMNTMTLYAQWERDSYTVRFDANGGAGSMDDENMWSLLPLPLYQNRFTRESHSFLNWNTAPDGSGVTYADGSVVTDLGTPGETVTLYAQWKQELVPDGPSDEQPSPDEARPLLPTGDGVGAAFLAALAIAFCSLVLCTALLRGGKSEKRF